MTMYGIINLEITDNNKHVIGQYENSKYIYSYSGSIINNGSSSVKIKLYIQTDTNGQTETPITIPSGTVVRFINLKFKSVQIMTSSPDIYIIATQVLREINEGLKEIAEIFYE